MKVLKLYCEQLKREWLSGLIQIYNEMYEEKENERAVVTGMVDKRKFYIFNWNPEGEIQTVLDRQYFKG